MKKTRIKTFKRYLKEDKETYYTLDLFQNMTKEDVIYYMNELLSLTSKMLKNSDVMITVEPILDKDEE